MALFQKRPQTTTSLPYYTPGTNKTILVIGLGNPGDNYVDTRHNIGFAAVDYFATANDFSPWVLKKDLKCLISLKNVGEAKVILIKPTTFMNASGEAASAVQRFYRVYNDSTLAIYDELAIKFGQLRTRAGGSDAGHNGVKSLIQHIGEDFGRLRIGIAQPERKSLPAGRQADAFDFVLGKFTKEEQGSLPLILREANDLINGFIFGGQLPHETRSIL